MEQFRTFIDSVDHWLAKNRERAHKIFQTFDANNTGKITHDQLKAGAVLLLYVMLLSLHQFFTFVITVVQFQTVTIKF